LPDFWLPDMDCWIEIKGEAPTEKEIHKARSLSLYKNKRVYIIWGTIGKPYNKECPHRIFAEHPPCLEAWRLEENDSRDIPLSLDLRLILQRLAEVSIKVRLGTQDRIVLKQDAFCWGLEDLSHYTKNIQKQMEILESITPLLLANEKELVDILAMGKGSELLFHEQESSSCYEWLACSHCKTIEICQIEGQPLECHNCDHGILSNDSSRLIAAYEAACQAR